jgi:hypothetical protein
MSYRAESLRCLGVHSKKTISGIIGMPKQGYFNNTVAPIGLAGGALLNIPLDGIFAS